MTLDSLVAVAAFLLAAYAIMPRPRRLAFGLRVSWVDWVILAIVVLLIHYLQFYSFFGRIGWTPKLDLAAWGITPERGTYLTIVVGALGISVHLSLAKLTARRMRRFVAYVQELLRTEQYYDLATLLDSHLNSLIALAGPMQSHSGSVTADDLLRQLTTLRPFVRFLTKGHPDLGIRIAKLDHSFKCDFTDLFLEEMLADKSSLLYTEIRNNQGLEDLGYHMPEENRLLYAMVNDARFAEQCCIYQPIGDAIIAELGCLLRSSGNDPYLLPVDKEFREKGQWQSKLYVGISFFDIMVWCALKQGIRWHMWLYYFPHITKEICRNCDRHPRDLEQRAEWPNRYCYLLYKMFSTMASWASAVTHDHFHTIGISLNNTSTENQNDNIPKSSIIAIGRCLEEVLKASSIPTEFKNYMMDIVLSRYFLLRRYNIGADYAEVLLKVITKPTSPEYMQAVADGFDAFDTIPYLHEDVEKVRGAIQGM